MHYDEFVSNFARWKRDPIGKVFFILLEGLRDQNFNVLRGIATSNQSAENKLISLGAHSALINLLEQLIEIKWDDLANYWKEEEVK